MKMKINVGAHVGEISFKMSSKSPQNFFDVLSVIIEPEHSGFVQMIVDEGAAFAGVNCGSVKRSEFSIHIGIVDDKLDFNNIYMVVKVMPPKYNYDRGQANTNASVESDSITKSDDFYECSHYSCDNITTYDVVLCEQDISEISNQLQRFCLH